jgi:hypothetical protein
MAPRKDSPVTAQTVSATGSRESTPLASDLPTERHGVLDPDLTDFCSHLHITPAIREFHDDDNDSNSDLHVSDNPSDDDITQESDLKKFTQALHDAQIAALKKETKKRRGSYLKNSKKTLKRKEKYHTEMASKGFLPLHEFMRLKGLAQEQVKHAPEPDKTVVREESEEGSDNANGLDKDTCTSSSVSDASEVEPEGNLPGTQRNALLHLTHHARMESEESSGDDDGGSDRGGDRDYTGQHISEDKTEMIKNDETLTISRRLKDLRRNAVPAHEDISQHKPGSISQLLSDPSKLREASTQLTKEEKNDNLDVIVRARVAAMVGLLNIYTDADLGYSWRKASEIVAKAKKRGTYHARRIREWVVDFLRWRDLPLSQLKWERWTILDDEDISEEIRGQLTQKASSGFLKAEDVVDIIASPVMQDSFARKGILKTSISVKTGHRWLKKLGWTYGTLRNGMYLDGHEREDVVEYRKAFVERWMEHERRFHRWDHNGTELPRPNGFPVPGAMGRFRLIPVTHDESTFFQNDERNTGWSHATSKSKPKAKGNGQSLMVSDFLTPDWGRLRDGDE